MAQQKRTNRVVSLDRLDKLLNDAGTSGTYNLRRRQGDTAMPLLDAETSTKQFIPAPPAGLPLIWMIRPSNGSGSRDATRSSRACSP
jgi:hypothetical protein